MEELGLLKERAIWETKQADSYFGKVVLGNLVKGTDSGETPDAVQMIH